MDFEEQDRTQPGEELFDLDMPQEPPKKKKKNGLIIGIIAAVVAVAAVIGLLFGLGVFAKDPHEAMLAAEKETLYSAVDSLAAGIGSARTAEQLTGSGADMDMHLLLGENLLDFLETMLTQMDTETELQLDWLKDIAMHWQIDSSSTQIRYLIGLGLGDKEIAKLDMIMDLDKAAMYLGMPELNPYYMTTELESAAVSGMFEQYQDLMEEFLAAMPEEAAMQSSLRSYVDLLLTLLRDPLVGEETVSVDGLEQTYTTLTYRITEKQLVDFWKAVLEKAKTDQALKQLMTALGSYMNGLMQSSDPDWVETDLYAEFLKVLEEGITGLENHTAQEGNYLELIGYLDKKQNLKGHKLMVSSVDEAPFALLTWLTAEDGDAERVRIVLCEEEETLLTGIGKQTEKDGVYNGTFELTFGDKQTLTLEMKDLHYNDQMLNGTIQLTPNIKLLKELLGDSYTSVRMMLGGELGLRLDLEGGMEAGSCGLHLTSEGESVIGLTVGAAYREGKPITLPEKDAILTGEEASTRWSEAMDLEALMKKLEEAGIPTELLESLEQSMTGSAPVLPDEAA